jgi:hypothetical protein
MEENKKPEKTEQTTQVTPPKKDPFSLFGKIAAILIVVLILVGGGVYLGSNLNKNPDKETSESMPAKNASNISPTAVQSPSPVVTQTNEKLKTVTAGGAKEPFSGLMKLMFLPAG